MADIRGTNGDDNSERALIGTEREDRIAGGRGNDDIQGRGRADVLLGGPGDDFIDGGRGPDRIVAGDGNDFVIGGQGNDVVDLGPGFNTISFEGAPAGATVDLGAGTALDGFGSRDRISGEVSTVIGSDFDDTLRGGAGFVSFAGLAGSTIAGVARTGSGSI